MRLNDGFGKAMLPIFLGCMCIFFSIMDISAATFYVPNLADDTASAAVFRHSSSEIVHLYLIDNEPRDFLNKKLADHSYSVSVDPGKFDIGLSAGNHSFVLFTNKYWDDKNLGGSFRVTLAMEKGKTYILKRKPSKEWYVECDNQEVVSAVIDPVSPFANYVGSDVAYVTIPPFVTDNKISDDTSWHAIDVLFVDKAPGSANKKFWPFINNYDTKRTIALSPGEHELLFMASTRNYDGPSILQKMIITVKSGERSHLEITKIEEEKGGACVTLEKIVD